MTLWKTQNIQLYPNVLAVSQNETDWGVFCETISNTNNNYIFCLWKYTKNGAGFAARHVSKSFLDI